MAETTENEIEEEQTSNIFSLSPPEKKVFVVGPFNTGTNLMAKILMECTDVENKDSIKNSGNDNICWKHALNIDEFVQDPNAIVIVMYKNIYNWLYSIKKEKYEIKMTHIHMPVEIRDQKFLNIIDLYNSYYRMYMHHIVNNPNVIFVNYRGIIDKNKSSVYRYLRNKLQSVGIKMTAPTKKLVEVLNKPAKIHGGSVSASDEALAQWSKNQILFREFIHRRTTIGKFVSKDILRFFENLP
jgi:hypothetical protein